MTKLISLVCILTQTRTRESRATLPSMGLMKGQYVFLVTNTEVLYILSFFFSGGSLSDFIKMYMLISLDCACTLFKTTMYAW